MQTVPTAFFGADIGQAQIVIARHGLNTPPISLANTRTALKTWLRDLPEGAVLAMEATGGYQRLLAELAHARGLTVYVINPQWLHHYARSQGQRGKTDRLDARMIARFAAQQHERLHPYQPDDPAIAAVRDDLALRNQVVRLRTALRLSAQRHRPANPVVKRRTALALKALQDLADTLQQSLLEPIQAQPALHHAFQRLTSLDGIGTLNGAALTALFARIPFQSADAVVAYAGLDPRPKESGKFLGRRKLSKQGDRYLRHLLYNAASAACRTKTFKPYYLALRDKGFASVQALNILARKLLRIAFALWHSRQNFDPDRFDYVQTGQKP